jgi:hypothetical protein
MIILSILYINKEAVPVEDRLLFLSLRRLALPMRH